MWLATRLGLVMASLLLGSCAPSVCPTDVTLTRYDKDTEYAVTPRDTGFLLTIYYSRYQFVPESEALAVACKSALLSLAHTLADQQGKPIRPIDEQRVRLTTSRNGFRGITSCAATAIAEWED